MNIAISPIGISGYVILISLVHIWVWFLNGSQHRFQRNKTYPSS